MSGLLRYSVMPSLSPGIYLRPPTTPPFPFGDPNCRLYRLARHALFHGVSAIGLRPDDEILVPAYHHGSEIEALHRAGLQCRFYGLLEDLEPDEASLERARGHATRALLLTHFAGFPQQVDYWRRWCDERSLLLIEDAAQAWLASSGGQPVGAAADAAIFCLYKTYGLPEGGALVSRPAAPSVAGEPAAGLRGLARRHAEWLVPRATRRRPQGAPRPTQEYSAEEDFDLGDADQPASLATRIVLNRLVPGAAQLRREHFTQLNAVLHDFVPKPFSSLPLGASPFFFPVASDRRAEVLSSLRACGIAANAFWSTPHRLLGEEFPELLSLRRRVVALPLHQELGEGDIDEIAAAAYRILSAFAR